MKKILLLSIMIVGATAMSYSQLLNDVKPKTKPVESVFLTKDTKKVTAKKRDAYMEISDGFIKNDLRTTTENEVLAYAFPNGYYHTSMDIRNGFYNEYFPTVIAPAYINSTWKNVSVGVDPNGWVFYNPQYPIGGANVPDESTELWISTTEENPSISYPVGAFVCPGLMGTIDGEDYLYFWGGNDYYDGGVILAGGKPQKEDTSSGAILDYGATNIDIQNYDLAITELGPGSYAYGTNSFNSIVSICERFSKPEQLYMLDQVRINVPIFTAPVGYEFKLIIHRMVDGALADTIATSTCTTEEVYRDELGSDATWMIFNGFTTIDEDGFEITLSTIEIQDEIMVEMTGFANNSNITLAVSDQKYESYNGKSTAYIMREMTNDEGQKYNKLYSTVDYLSAKPKTSFAVALGITYSFLSTTDGDNTFNAPIEGGQKIFDVMTYYEPIYSSGENTFDVLEFENVPEWASVSFTFDADVWETKVTFIVEALPEGTGLRSETVKATIPGASFDFILTQDRNGSGIGADRSEATVKVVNINKSLILTYGQDFTSVSIYNLSGLKVGYYSLPADGELTIPKNQVGEGVHILKFEGKEIEIIKTYIRD